MFLFLILLYHHKISKYECSFDSDDAVTMRIPKHTKDPWASLSSSTQLEESMVKGDDFCRSTSRGNQVPPRLKHHSLQWLLNQLMQWKKMKISKVSVSRIVLEIARVDAWMMLRCLQRWISGRRSFSLLMMQSLLTVESHFRVRVVTSSRIAQKYTATNRTTKSHSVSMRTRVTFYAPLLLA